MATREQLIEDFADHKYATGEKFARLINSMKLVQEPVESPAESGTSNSFIDSISQGADGKITATKKSVVLNYAQIQDKPTINGVTLMGDKTPAQLGLATANQVETLSNKVDKLPTGYYYGKFSSVEDLPEATEKGYAYVASTNPTVFYTYLVSGAGAEWVDSGNKMVNTIDITTLKTAETELSKGEKYYASANINDRPAQVDSDTSVVMALGYKVLDPRKSFAEQVESTQTVDNSSMIFEIKDSFDLNGGSVTIPAGCTLKFNGGKLTNGTLVGNYTTIDAPATQIFEQGTFKYRGYSDYQGQQQETLGHAYRAYSITGGHIIIAGTWSNQQPKAEWLGLNTIELSVDSSPIIQNYINLHDSSSAVKIPKRVYGIFGNINITDRTFDAQGSTFNILAVSTVYDQTIEIPDGMYPLTAPVFPQGIAPLTYVIRIGTGKLYNLTIDGANITYGSTGSTTDTYVHNKIGRYGLIGGLSHGAEVVGCTIVNAYQCGILDAGYSDVLIKDTTIKNCIEHCIYCRPTHGGTMTIENCNFDTWYRQTTHRTGAKALKIVQADNIESNVSEHQTANKLTLNITNCNFTYNGTSNPLFQLSIGAAYTNIQGCNLTNHLNMFRFSDGTSNVDGYATKVNIVTFKNCIGGSFLQKNTSNHGSIIYYYNCKGLKTEVLQFASIIYSCELEAIYVDEVDYRSHINAENVTENRSLLVKNTDIFAKGSPITDWGTYIDGAYDITFDTVKLVEEFSTNNALRITFKTNTNDTVVSQPTKVTLYNCDFRFKNLNASIAGKNYDITIINSVFAARFSTGYPARYCVFNSAKSLTLDNVKSAPYEGTGDIVNLYRKDTTNQITYKNINTEQNGYVSPTYGKYYPAKGTSNYDYNSNMPVFWRGDEYQRGRVFIKRTLSNIEKLSATEIGTDCYLTDVHKWITWSGEVWFNSNGESPFIQITQGAAISGVGSSDTPLNVTINAYDDSIADKTLTFSSSESWCSNIELYGTANNKLRADIGANEQATSRTCTITITQGSGSDIATKTFELTQNPKSVLVDFSATSIDANGGSITFNRHVGGVNIATITTDADWITLPETIDNATSATNTISIAANSGTERTATLTVTGTNTLTKEYTITQTGLE